ncbi:hypothetical protein TNCV_1253431 [Trichonephila clavipes]|nr:hypothetical protein TNCV_1253431 [Trichonephila clavipes]
MPPPKLIFIYSLAAEGYLSLQSDCIPLELASLLSAAPYSESESLRGNMQSEDGPRATRTSSIDKNVLYTVRRNPNTEVGVEGGSQSNVYRVLQHECPPLPSYHLQR